MASGGTLDPKVMTLKDKDRAVQMLAFSTALGNSSNKKAWNAHEERLAQHFQSILELDNDFEEIKQKEASAFSPMTDLGKACLKYIDASRKYNNEYPFGHPVRKNKYKEERIEQKEIELDKLQAQLQIANVESQKTVSQQQMQLKIEEVEGSIKASTISGSLMSLALTDKNSDIKSWLDRRGKERDEVPLLPKRSHDQRDSSRYKTLSLRKPKSNLERKNTNQPDRSRLMQKELAIMPISLTQRLVSPNKAHSTIDSTGNTNDKPKSNVLPPPGFGDFKPKKHYEFSKRAFEIEPNFQPQVSAVPLTQMSTQVMHVSIPKLKISEFHGDPLHWPEWSSLFTATIRNAPIDDNAKMCHLKTLVKGKAKAAIAEA